MKITDATSNVLAAPATIPAGQSRKIPLTLTAMHLGTSIVKLDVTGPSHFHVSREWTISVMDGDVRLGPAMRQRIEPQQSTSWPPYEKAHAKDDSILFLAAAPLGDAPAWLTDVLGAEAFTTGEITGILETLRLWRGTIITAGLEPEAALDMRERDLFLRLLARQKPDGGFSSLPGSQIENQADFVSTSQALMTLAHSDQSLAKPAMEQAAGWLRQRLENTWFDERERPERAAAYAALAEANRLDNASLHYFSDTSAQKTLPPLAAVQLAFAFAKIGDKPASSFWIDTSGVGKALSSLPDAIMPVLADNVFFDPQSLWPAVDALSSKDPSGDIEFLTNILHSIWTIQKRKGVWHVAVNADKRNPKDIVVISIPAKMTAPVIHNTGNEPVFLSGSQRIETSSFEANAVTRHIYQLNGTEVGGRKPLGRDETYLVVLEGSWPENTTGSILVHDDLSPALRVAGCLPPAPMEADDLLAWLKSQSLAAASACETWGGGIDMLLTREDNVSATSWRVAYLAKAIWAGVFNLQPASAQILAARHRETVKTSKDRIEIR